MKIIQILPELHGGGVERGTLEIGRFLASQGHQSLVVSNGGRLVGQLQSEGSRHIRLAVHRKRLSVMTQVGELRRLFLHERPEIVHVRSRLPAWLAWLAWKTIAAGIRPRLVTTVHGFYSVNFYSKIMTLGERVICVSESVRDYVRQNFPAVPESRLTVIHRGVCATSFPNGYQPAVEWRKEWKSRYPELENKFVLTLPGRITKWKGQLDFVRIIHKLKQQNIPVHGLIVGEAHVDKANYAQSVRAAVKSGGLEQDITFTGYRRDLKEIMAVSHAVVSCSNDPEAFGRVTLEAMCLGRPVAAYAHGGVAEQMQVLFPAGMIRPGNWELMAETLIRWFKYPPVPSKFGDHPFTLDRFNRSTLKLYQELSATPVRNVA